MGIFKELIGRSFIQRGRPCGKFKEEFRAGKTRVWISALVLMLRPHWAMLRVPEAPFLRL